MRSFKVQQIQFKFWVLLIHKGVRLVIMVVVCPCSVILSHWFHIKRHSNMSTPSLCTASRWAQLCVPNYTLTAQLITCKNSRCATCLLIRYVGLPFVILILFMYDMYFAVIVIWLCICLDPWSIKKLLLRICSYNGLALNRRQAIIWTNEDLAYRRRDKTLGRDVLKTASRRHEDCQR